MKRHRPNVISNNNLISSNHHHHSSNSGNNVFHNNNLNSSINNSNFTFPYSQQTNNFIHSPNYSVYQSTTPIKPYYQQNSPISSIFQSSSCSPSNPSSSTPIYSPYSTTSPFSSHNNLNTHSLILGNKSLTTTITTNSLSSSSLNSSSGSNSSGNINTFHYASPTSFLMTSTTSNTHSNNNNSTINVSTTVNNNHHSLHYSSSSVCNETSITNNNNTTIEDINNKEELNEEEQMKEYIQELKVEHRTNMSQLFKHSLKQHRIHCEKIKTNATITTNHALTIKKKQRKKKKKRNTMKTLTIVEIPKEFNELKYSYFEYLTKNKIAQEETKVTFIPYTSDDAFINYNSYSKYFEDLRYIHNINNAHKKSDYTKFLEYYTVTVIDETAIENLLDKVVDKYGDSDKVLRLIAKDIIIEYEQEIASEIKNMDGEHLKHERNEFLLIIMELFQTLLTHHSIGQRARLSKSTPPEKGELKTIWDTTAKLFCFKCMKFDCPVHRDEYDTCVRGQDDVRVNVAYNNMNLISDILIKLIKYQEEYNKAFNICGNECYRHYNNTIGTISDNYNDWLQYDKDLVLNTIFIYGERILKRLKGEIKDNLNQLDIYCQISRYHRKPCCQVKRFLTEWITNFKPKPIKYLNENSTCNEIVLKEFAPSFFDKNSPFIFVNRIIEKVNFEKELLPKLHRPSIYNPCQCRLKNIERCVCVENGTYCTELCNCFTKENMYPICNTCKCTSSKNCSCRKLNRTCTDRCNCENCDNKFSILNYKLVAVGLSSVQGLGLFTLEDIKKHELIIEYVGELVSVPEENRRSVLYDIFKSSYLFELKQEFSVDAYRKGNEARFINDADGVVKLKKTKNNCFPKVIFDDTTKDYKIGIYALHDIKKNSELFFSYGKRFWTNVNEDVIFFENNKK
ncbi:hypothetical protein ABK040_010908 [Willaertia magna]